MLNQEKIHRKAQSKTREKRIEAIEQFRSNFINLPNKEMAWKDLILLTQDEDTSVRWNAAFALRSVFNHVLDKGQAWKDLHRLAKDKNKDVRWGVAGTLDLVFPYAPDKNKAWKDLHRLTKDKNSDVRKRATSAIGSAFSDVPDKEKACVDLHRLTKDKNSDIRFAAAVALKMACHYIPDKEQAWRDLVRLVQDKNGDVQHRALDAAESLIGQVPDKEQAWRDLIFLAQDKKYNLRERATSLLGSFFPHVPDKEQAWMDLIHLTYDREKVVRMLANHSLGRASIFKATEAENEKIFREELENALKFFEIAAKKSKNDSFYFKNPASFCFPFYQSYYTLTFKKQESEKEINKYLAKARNAVKGSENKEKLLEAVENLANALKEVQNVQVTDLNTKKSDLDAYRRYCDRVADILETTQEKAPGATKLIKKGLPIIDETIKNIISEIQEKAKALCIQAKGTHFEELGKEVNIIGQTLSQIRDPIGLEKRVHNMQIALSAICAKMPEEDRGDACELLKKAKNEPFIEDKIELINMVLTKIPYHMNKEEVFKESEKNEIPYLAELESEICDIFKSVYQKDVKAGVSEVNSKTLEFLKYKLHDLAANGKEIHWLDVGCGNGRCLHVLDAIQNMKNIRYHGIDCSYRYLDDAEKIVKKYNLYAKVEKMEATAMKFDSKYDLVSAVLLLHEIDPLCLPYVLKNMLRAIKDDGTLVISDFEGPYEQEEGVVAWSADEIKQLFENIGGAKISIDFVPSGEFPTELGFYRCYVKKSELDEENFESFLKRYGDFLKTKKEDSKKKRDELRSQINKRVSEILNRPNIDTKNIYGEEMARIKAEIGKEYGIKAHKIRLLTNQIIFLDDKINDFDCGKRCAGVD